MLVIFRDENTSTWFFGGLFEFKQVAHAYAKKWRNSLTVEDAEDAMQEALLVINQKYKDLSDKEIQRTFNTTAFRFLSRRYRERKQTLSTTLMPNGGDDDQGSAIEYDVPENALSENGFEPEDSRPGLAFFPSSSTMTEQIVAALTLEKIIAKKASDKQKEIVSLLLEDDDCGYDDIAKTLRMQPGTVKSHMHRFKAKAKAMELELQ